MPTNTSDSQVFQFVDAFESAHVHAQDVDFADYLPDQEHPLYDTVLRELIRIDLEFGWQSGQPKPLEHYRRRYPRAFAQPEAVAEITFEEYRQRVQAGQQVSPLEYARRYHVNVSAWPGDTGADKETAARRLRPASSRQAPVNQVYGDIGEKLHGPALAVPGRFLDFELVELLGKGAFGQVFLARQDQLSDRLVALKVGSRLFTESQKLAQLQHTNIVPIYSLHQDGPHQAVCMPFLGATTLADVLECIRWDEQRLPTSGSFLVETIEATSRAQPRCSRLKERLSRISYVDAVLELAARLAGGLAHAHARGIVHRDLKPANILLSVEAEPLLLDFNLSQDLKSSSLSDAVIGGTLPYMAPEQLDAFRTKVQSADPRSDLYALGIILFELLSGRFPFQMPEAPVKLTPELFNDRQGPPPALRPWNEAVSPAVEAIVHRCLQPDAARRYQSATELETDLRCQLENRPLRHAGDPSRQERVQKWLRRHPRLASSTSVAALGCLVALVLLVLHAARGRHLEALQVAENSNQLLDDLRLNQFLSMQQRQADEQVVAGLVQQTEHLAAHPALAAEQRRRLQEQTGDLLLTAASLELKREGARTESALELNEAAEKFYGAQVPAVLWRQRGQLLLALARTEEARNVLGLGREQPAVDTARDLGLEAAELAFQGRPQDAVPLLERATRLEPQNFRAWFDLGHCYEQLDQHAAATACFNACSALMPEFAPIYFKRGVSYLRQNKNAQAAADFDLAVSLSDKAASVYMRVWLAEVYVHRALARLGLNELEAAARDIDKALAVERCPTRAYFIKAHILEQQGERERAQQTRTRGLALTPRDEMSWLARGSVCLANDPEQALRDFDQALRLNPGCRLALQNKAHLLAEQFRRGEEAVAVLDRLVALDARQAPALGGRGVLLARLGQRDKALRDARACLIVDSSPKTLYQVGCIYALTSRQHAGDAAEALVFLAAALRQGYGQRLLDSDKDLDALRSHPGFAQLRQAGP